MDSTTLKLKFDAEWGAFRRFIAANPLTGFWTGVAAGAAAVFIASRFLF